MSSRRLSISFLLSDDSPQPVVQQPVRVVVPDVRPQSSSQLPLNQRLAFSDSDSMRSSQPDLFHVSSSPTQLPVSPLTQRLSPHASPFAYARPPSQSHMNLFSPLSPTQPPPQLQLLPPSRYNTTPYIYSQSQPRPSSSTGDYAVPTHSSFDVRSRSYSDPDTLNRDFVQYRRTPSPPLHSPSLTGGLDALVQAASQERRRLSIDHAYTRHHAAYSPPPPDSYTRLGSSHGRAYIPEYGANNNFEPPHKRRRSSDSQHEPIKPQVLVAEGVQERPDRSSFMRISHIASGYHPLHSPQSVPPMQELQERLSLSRSSPKPSESLSSPNPIAFSPSPEQITFEKRHQTVPVKNVTEGNEQAVSIHFEEHLINPPLQNTPRSPPVTVPAPPMDVKQLETEIPISRPPSVPSNGSNYRRSPSFTSEDALKQDDDITVDIEFDLAATKSESNFEMDLDVEDELLRLVDDDPARNRARASRERRRSFSTPTTDLLLEDNETSLPPSTPKAEQAVSPHPQPPPEASASKPQKQTKGTGPRKKQTGGKAQTKPKQPGKPRGKAAAKAKNSAIQNNDYLPVSYTASGRLTKPSSSAVPSNLLNAKASVFAVSRSVSVERGADVEHDQDDQDKDNVDDKVYCICKSPYEEGRVMIACDRCDEWYHMECLGMSDLEVDLVDQFVCPVCVENNPQSSLGTTYKQRCLAGLKDPNPSSPEACHKAARGAFSKYCSEECGVSYMQVKIESWPGNKAKLWETVKDADKREGVVTGVPVDLKMETDVDPAVSQEKDQKPKRNKQKERELVRLQEQLDKVVQIRDVMKMEMEVIIWRKALTQLATDRAEDLDECGWDQRLCLDDEDYTEMGAAILESYESQAGEVQDNTFEDAGEWWCRGKKKCDRHAGWQKLRSTEVAVEKEMKEMGLSKLATSEREIRKRIEDITDPQRPASVTTNTNAARLNGKGSKSKLNGTTVKNGKKRKAVG